MNSRKHSNFHKTNHAQLCAVSPPDPMARKTNWQTDETNRGTLTTESAGDSRLTYEKDSSSSCNTSHSYKTNHPASPLLFPSMTGTQVSSVHLKFDAGGEVLA